MLAKSALIALLFALCAPAEVPVSRQEPGLVRSSSPAPQKVSFETEVRPILEKRCRPCHFEGGKMYAQLPFDRAQTIRTLGDKLFTRIRDEKEQRLLRSFLAQEAVDAR
jgi:hypothetical protein